MSDRKSQREKAMINKQEKSLFISNHQPAVTLSSGATGRNIRHGLAASAAICIFLFA